MMPHDTLPQPRYAIYLAPAADTPLWRFGSAVLGYDAETGQDLRGFTLDGFVEAEWRALASRPRLYGFHATLKAPFRLAEGRSRAELTADLKAFAAARTGFDLGPLAVTSLRSGEGGFVALTPQYPVAELVALEAATVMHFDRYRAPLSQAERAARRPELLSMREREHLDRWGYPHVLDAYRFHMTLTGFLSNPDEVADRLAIALANQLGTAHLRVDALVLFEQPDAGQPFRIIQRAALA